MAPKATMAKLGGYLPARGARSSGLKPARGKMGSSSSLGGLVEIDYRGESPGLPEDKVRSWLGSNFSRSEGQIYSSAEASRSTGSLSN